MNPKQYSVLHCLLLLSLPAARADSKLEPAELLEIRKKAEAAYQQKDASTAKSLYLQLTANVPNDPEAWFGLSRAYEWSGAWGRAIDAAERVQSLGYFGRPYLSYRLAQLNQRAGQSDKALEWLEIALQQGYEDRPSIQIDDVFLELHSNPRFVRLAGMLPNRQMSRTEGLRFDLDYLVEEAQRMHASPEGEAFSPKFRKAATELRDAIPDLSDPDVFAGMLRLLAILDDGHTAIYRPDNDTPLELSFGVLPLKFYWFAEGVFVIDGLGDSARFAASRVLKFGDLTAQETLERLSALRGVDNSMTWRWMGPQFYLGRVQALQIVGATDSAERVKLTLQHKNGHVTENEFAGGMERPTRKLRPSRAINGDVPLYLQNVDKTHWLSSIPEFSMVYFQFNQVRNGENESLADFSTRLNALLESTGASSLVIDVRHNNGGNNSLLRPLIRTVVAFEQASLRNKIFVITGRNTFSAAQNFINKLEQLTDAVFVGEPSSSSPNFVGEETNLLLPYSRLRGSISNRYWQDSSPGDHRPWITPHVPVEPTAADYFSGKDAAMAAIFEITKSASDK